MVRSTSRDVCQLIQTEVQSYLPGDVRVCWDEDRQDFRVDHGHWHLCFVSGEYLRREGLDYPEDNIFRIAALQLAGCRVETRLRLSGRGQDVCRCAAQRSNFFRELGWEGDDGDQTD